VWDGGWRRHQSDKVGHRARAVVHNGLALLSRELIRWHTTVSIGSLARSLPTAVDTSTHGPTGRRDRSAAGRLTDHHSLARRANEWWLRRHDSSHTEPITSYTLTDSPHCPDIEHTYWIHTDFRVFVYVFTFVFWIVLLFMSVMCCLWRNKE